MPITFKPSFFDSNGQAHETLKAAQEAELRILLGDEPPVGGPEWVEDIVLNAERIVDILTTKKNSRAKARAINGGRKNRKPKPEQPVSMPPAVGHETGGTEPDSTRPF